MLIDIKLLDIKDEFIINSSHYRSLIENMDSVDEIIQIDSRFYIQENASIEQRLCMYHYWDVDKLPDDIIDHLIITLEFYDVYPDVLSLIKKFNPSNFDEGVEILKKLKYTGSFCFLANNKDHLLNFSSACGNLELIKIHVKDITVRHLAIMAAYGNLECLRCAHENGCLWDVHKNGYSLYSAICTIAAMYGHLDCLIYAHENGCPWNSLTCSHTAEEGNLDCLIYAHENGCEWDAKTCSGAAMNGHLLSNLCT